MRLPRPVWAPAALMLLFAAVPAWAQLADKLKLNASYALQHDNNLFRLPAGADLQALIGKASAVEQIGITTLGLSIKQALSLQRFELDLSLIDYHYQNFSHLSFVAQNYHAAWRWGLTPRLRGSLSTERKETLNSFADYQGFNQRNQRTNNHTRFDAAYELDGAWLVLAGASQAAQTNRQPLVAEADYRTRQIDLGLRRAFASGSALTYTVKSADGNYLNRILPSAALLDDGFRQTDSELRAHWAVNAHSSAALSAAHIRRSHTHYAQRNYSGFNTGATLNWSLGAKSALAAGLSRELASYQTSNSNYSQTDRVYLSPSWQLNPKALVRLRGEVARRNYLGAATSAPQRSDSMADVSLSFDWQPQPYVTVGAALQSARRRSNLAGLDYQSSLATVSAQFSF